MTEAGVAIIGGHTIKDKEPKYGFVVMGLIHPDKILDNSKARPGDAIILTKKIGTGIISTGVKAGLCSDAVIEDFTKSMAALNKRACEIMIEVGVSTATDVTGFGLLGHMFEVLSASRCAAHVHMNQVPFFTEAIRLAEIKKVPGGTISNCKNYEPYIKWRADASDTEKYLLNDTQTSGGLLIFVPKERKNTLTDAMQKEGILAAYIGDVMAEASLAQKNHADFALWGVYTLSGSEIQLNARWIDPVKKAAAGIASRTGALNLSFDAVVASLVDEIVEGQKKRFADLPPEQIEKAPPVPAAAQQPAAPLGPAVASDSTPAVSSVVSAPKAEPRIAPLAFSLGSAPFIATFTALNYFPVGLSVSLTGLYRVRAPGGLLGFGLATGLSGFHGKGTYTQADFFIIPIGVDFLYGTRTGSAIDFFAHLDGGPAIFAAKPATGNLLTKVIPYISGGVGITFSFFDSFGISLDGSYVCFFDSPDPIMGFAPSLSVLVRL